MMLAYRKIYLFYTVGRAGSIIIKHDELNLSFLLFLANDKIINVRVPSLNTLIIFLEVYSKSRTKLLYQKKSGLPLTLID